MTCVSGVCGAGGAGAASQMMSQVGGAQGLGGGAQALAGGTGAPGDLMSKVMEILKKLGLDGQGGEQGIMSRDDLTKLFKALQQMGPEGMQKVMKANPAMTNALSQVL